MIVKYQNKVVSHNSKWVGYSGEPGPGPEPQLPPYTLRLKFKDGVTPSFRIGTGTLVDATNNIWDLTYENTNWTNLLQNQTNLLEVLDANTTDVIIMKSMFNYCIYLTTVPLFDTSNVTIIWNMFRHCERLTSVPLFDTSNATDMYGVFDACYNLITVPLLDTSKATRVDRMFRDCHKVQSGALALYQQMSTQSTPPSSHSQTFTNCGSNTTTGAAELAQIPTSWGGTMS